MGKWILRAVHQPSCISLVEVVTHFRMKKISCMALIGKSNTRRTPIMYTYFMAHIKWNTSIDGIVPMAFPLNIFTLVSFFLNLMGNHSGGSEKMN